MGAGLVQRDKSWPLLRLGLGNPTAQVMSDDMKDKVRETNATEI